MGWGAMSRRVALLGGGAAIGAALARPPDARGPALIMAPAGQVLDDASELSATVIRKHVKVTAGLDRMDLNQIGLELTGAAKGQRPLIASGARHSMGAHSLSENGVVLTLSGGRIEADAEGATYRAAAGARWSEVIDKLDPIGFSPLVMQSNNDFAVASTFCVNAHGWAAPHPPAGSSVLSFEMMTAQGKRVACSRRKNPETFAAMMGGYGLTGVITDLELRMTPNLRLAPHYERMPGEALGTRLRDGVRAKGVEMAYGRLDVSRDSFFGEALLVTYRPTEDQLDLPQANGSGFMSRASRHVFRAQLGHEGARRARWWVEAGLSPRMAGPVTRNALLDEPVATLDDRDPRRTDILHEYFVTPEAFPAFVRLCRAVIPESYQELLNITLRWVEADTESWLSYAPEPRVAAVMLFSQEKTARAEADMARMTRVLIDGTLALGGSYYLPYRPHATIEQFEAAYPRAREFARMKLRLDPERRFVSPFWTRYLEPLT